MHATLRLLTLPALALVWLIGAWAIVAGVLTVALALKLRKITS